MYCIEAELTVVIKAFKKNTAPSIDVITMALIRNLPTNGLTHYNNIWDTGIIPSGWNKSRIMSIPKPGKATDKVKSLPSIFLTSKFYKILERMVLHRINWAAEPRDLLGATQTGFRPISWLKTTTPLFTTTYS